MVNGHKLNFVNDESHTEHVLTLHLEEIVRCFAQQLAQEMFEQDPEKFTRSANDDRW